MTSDDARAILDHITAQDAENKRLRNVLDVERYKVAIGVQDIARTVQGRQWLAEPGRGIPVDMDVAFNELADAIAAGAHT